MNVENLEQARKKVPNVPILINMITRRVRQLNRGFRPYVKPKLDECAMDIALREVAEGTLTSEISFKPGPGAPAGFRLGK